MAFSPETEKRRRDSLNDLESIDEDGEGERGAEADPVDHDNENESEDV